MNLIEEFREILEPIVERELGNSLLVEGTIYFKRNKEYLNEGANLNLYYMKNFPNQKEREKKQLLIEKEEMDDIYNKLNSYIHLPLLEQCDKLVVYFSHSKDVWIVADWKVKLKEV